MFVSQLDRLELAFDAVKKQLFSQLHNVLRAQLFDRPSDSEDVTAPIRVLTPGRTAENVLAAQPVKVGQSTENLDSVGLNGRSS
mgnify:CR=1 FL=1